MVFACNSTQVSEIAQAIDRGSLIQGLKERLFPPPPRVYESLVEIFAL
ncbi:hypothetical protein [Campylobacter upsaliensis]|nr:hypothetical protein [Campylobacter upsaliensis]